MSDSSQPMVVQITRPRRFIIFLVLLLLAAAYGVYFFFWGGSTVLRAGTISIAEGSSGRTVWERLVKDGYTRRTMPWRFWSWRLAATGKLKAGTYTLQAGESVRQAITDFMAGKVVNNEQTITYPEGFTLQQIAERTAARGIGTTNSFVAAAKPGAFADAYPFLKDLPAGRSLEGYLFPDTYQVAQDDSSADVITRMLGNFDRKVTPDIRQQAAAHKRSLDQVVIMASIIEREAVTTEDMGIISGILWKRFDDGTGLSVDATVRYALKKWDGRLTVQDLALDSPYNTRKYKGLPPGPISNPGLRAIMAAANPTASDYYYYLTTSDDKKTIYAKTNDEQNANKAKYLK
jgi:UPF0755 protein